MRHSPGRFRVEGVLICVALAALLAAAGTAPAGPPQLRGIWMHANYIRTPGEADACLEKVERANLNAIFLLVWYWGGQASFHTPLCPMLEGVQPGYDPLGYMAAACRRRKIELHAWFVNGSYGEKQIRYVLDRHPDWAVDGDQPDRPWYDLGQPEVRKFQSNLMIGALKQYDLDGLHFDYIRYDGPAYCYCKHCQQEFAARYGCGTIERPGGKSLPMAAVLAGNPVSKPTTARVLARFSDGTPAIATNELGQGHVVLFNWHATHPLLAPVAETMHRVLAQWKPAPGKLYVMDTAPNRQRYGRERIKNALDALKKLGHQAAILPEERLGKLAPDAVLVLPEVYLIPDAGAADLEQYVRAGGRLLVIDGPVLSIGKPAIQRVLGMNGPGKYMNGLDAIQPVTASDLLVSGGPPVDLEQVKRRAAKWAEYRQSGVTELVRDVYRRAKSLKPNTQITAAVFTPLASAERVYQDWPGWIRQGIIDYVIPMAYTPNTKNLEQQLIEWKTVDPRLERILPGLGIFTGTSEDRSYGPRPIDLILQQHRLCMDHGARGTCMFALDGTAAFPVLLLNEPLIEALRTRLHTDKAPAYRPPARESARK
jgi:uncharacterized lipoprotein YddW (UPF0748 family)